MYNSDALLLLDVFAVIPGLPVDDVPAVAFSARTIDIVRGGVPERIATDFGWGAAGTPVVVRP